MPVTPPAAERSKWRFSLKTLFLLTLLAVVIVWITSWRMWDLDERIILMSWILAVAGSINYSCRHSSRGIVLTTIVGALIPASVSLSYYLLWELVYVAELDWGSAEIETNEIPACVGFVALAGAALGAVSAAACTPGGLANLPPSQREDRVQRRLVVVSGLVVLFVLSGGAGSIYSRSTQWKIRGEVILDASSSLGLKSVALSSDGSHLKVVAQANDSPKQRSLMLWKLAPFNDVPTFTKLFPTRSITAISRDGNLVAIAENASPEVVISVVQSPMGEEVAKLTVPDPPDTFDDARVHFSADEHELRFSTRKFDDGDSPKTYRWQVNDWKPLAAIDDDHTPFLRSKFYVKVVELENSHVFDPKYRVELWDLGAKNLLHQFEPFSDPHPIVVSPDESQLAIHDCLIDLKTKRVREVSAVVEQFLPQSQVLLGSRRKAPIEGRISWKVPGVFSLPLDRHIWVDRVWEQLVLLDPTTGAIIRTSQWMPGSHSQAGISEDGKVAFTQDFDRIIVWEIPE